MREELLGPLLENSSAGVAFVAAVSLLQPEFRHANGRNDNDPLYFQYESLTFPALTLSIPAPTAPPMALKRQPAFLESVRRRIGEEPSQNDPTVRYTYALLLAQYGDNSALEAELTRWEAQPSQTPPDILLVALTITRDPRYLPPLKQKIATVENEYELRQMLQWLRGVSGAEARDLRREINKSIQQASGL